jgi:cytochrome P450
MQNLEVFTPHVNELVSSLRNKAKAGHAVDLKPMFFDFTLGTTTKLLFGEPYTSLSAEDRDAFQKSFDYAALVVGIRVRMADLAPLYNPRKFRDACNTVRNWATFFAPKALKYKDEVGEEEAASKYSFIIDLWKDMRDDDLVRDQLLHILIAGRDSTASLLSWTL